jgi:hypothetical protein
VIDWKSVGGQSGSIVRGCIYICETGTWRDGGRLRTDHHSSPAGELVLGNSHTGTWRNDWRWHGAAFPSDWAQPNDWLYRWHCLPHGEPPRSRTTLLCNYRGPGAQQRHFLSSPLAWWLLHSAQQPFLSTPNLISLHLACQVGASSAFIKSHCWCHDSIAWHQHVD